jgi:hypothetical protein
MGAWREKEVHAKNRKEALKAFREYLDRNNEVVGELTKIHKVEGSPKGYKHDVYACSTYAHRRKTGNWFENMSKRNLL